MGPDEKAQREIASWTSVITRYCKKGREKRFNYYMTLMMVNIFSSKICETKKQFMCSADLSGPCPKRLLCANCGILKQLFYFCHYLGALSVDDEKFTLLFHLLKPKVGDIIYRFHRIKSTMRNAKFYM